MRGRRKFSGSSLRVRFLGSEADRAHEGWYGVLAAHYDRLYDSKRVAKAYPFLHDLFRRRGPVKDVLDVACGTFALDLPLLRRGYRIVGRDRSEAMLSQSRRNLQASGRTADLAKGDMRSLELGRSFDAVLCLGTAFNYLATPTDARAAFRTFRRHLRPGGLLVLDLTNFDAWIRRPTNARAEVDSRSPDGTRIAIFALNDQDLPRRIHHARFLTAIQRGDRLDLAYSEAPLRIWTRSELTEALGKNGFQAVEWAGDLRLGAIYRKAASPRLVAVARRR